jgi:hypothetical protein
MRSVCILACSLWLSATAAQTQVESPDKGVIHGTVIDQDGTPAKGLILNARPLGVALAMALPWTKTSDVGMFRFEHLPFGRYIVLAEDREQGYSSFTTGSASPGNPQEVKLTVEHPEAEFNLRLPPKASFLVFHLTNQKTGVAISGVEVTVTSADNDSEMIFSGGFPSNQPVLVPSDRSLFLHVKSWGFREWDESVGRGKPIRIGPGDHLTLDVQLQPANPLRERIPDADPRKYQGIHDGKDWKNPCLIVKADGVVISGVTSDGNPISVGAVATALERLPDSAWPYGSVVAVQDIATSEPERPKIEAIRMSMESLLGELGIIVGFRPPSGSCGSLDD